MNLGQIESVVWGPDIPGDLFVGPSGPRSTPTLYVCGDEEQRWPLPLASQGHSADGYGLSLVDVLANKSGPSASLSGGSAAAFSVFLPLPLRHFPVCCPQPLRPTRQRGEAGPWLAPAARGGKAGPRPAPASRSPLLSRSFLLVWARVSFEAVIPRSVVRLSLWCAAYAAFALICDSLACSYFTGDVL